MLIDSHAHVNFTEFNEDGPDVLADCQKNNIWVINVGSQYQTSKKAIEISEQFEVGVYAAVALHPIHVLGSEFHPEEFIAADYAELVKSSKKVVAIGETGIDFFHTDSNFNRQKEVFINHINLAKEFALPLIVHGRDSRDGTKSAYQEILKILAKQNFKNGVIHCFGGLITEAEDFLDLGFYVGFTGIITFDKTDKLAEVIKRLPLEAILVETDSPYLAPVPNRGRRNQPQYVKYVAAKIAEIKQLPYNMVETKTVENTKKLFKI
ncbi:MAG: TatD family hydrolase [Patescibacteria group bacterium]|nr:TatD family hydrolase [Patescibacteria group bacterium]